MPVCRGCSGGGLTQVFSDDSNCISMLGLGTEDDPLEASLIIDPDGDNTLSCGPDGLFASGGGGGGGQFLYFTVGTPGVASFGNLGATPAAAFSTADFQGDGIDDSVAVQAGIDAIDALSGTGSAIILHILPGFYLINSTLQPKGVLIRGQHKKLVFWAMDSGFGSPTNLRMIDGSISGLNSLNIEEITISHNNGGAATIFVDHLYSQHMAYQAESPGTDLAVIVCQNITDDGLVLGKFNDNGVIPVSPADTSLYMGAALSFGNFEIIGNNFNGPVVIDSGTSLQGVHISRNFIFADLAVNIPFDTASHWFIHENQFTNGSLVATLATNLAFEWSIRDNQITNGNINISSLIASNIRDNYISAIGFGTGIQLNTCSENIIIGNFVDGALNDGMSLVTCSDNIIEGNRIRSYGDDGINITTSNENTVQGNDLTSGVATNGINVVSGTSNWVTNNDLRGSGSTPFVDTATSTSVTAGNRLA